MNRKLISKAITNIEDAYIRETMFPPAARTDRAPERTASMKKTRNNTRRLLRLMLAACLVFALALSAYAFNLWGIREMLQRSGRELPETAEPYIQHHTQVVGAEDWSARVTESLCDDSKVMVTVTVYGGDKYIIAPTDADPDTLAVNIGIEGDLTLGEYAAQQGKKLLFVGASLHDKDNGTLGGHGSQHFEHAGDGEMTILVQADAWMPEEDMICCVYAVDETWCKQTLQLPLILDKAPTGGAATYIPVDADAVPGMRAGNAKVTETPLGITIRIKETVTDETAYYSIKRVEFEGLAYGEGGTVLEDDGNWYLTVSGCVGAVGDTLTARYYNWDDQEIGQIVFKKGE